MTRYGTIIADPPWRYRNAGISGAAEKHYATLSTEELCALPVPALAAPDSVMILWATWPMLPDAMRVIDAWGFSYVTGLPWIKLRDIPRTTLFGEDVIRPSWGQGWWIRGCSEPILVCRRGKATPPADPPLGLISERFQHSRKPDSLYAYAETFRGPYLEMFARRSRAGWDAWGNEVTDSIALEGAST